MEQLQAQTRRFIPEQQGYDIHVPTQLRKTSLELIPVF